MLLPNFNIPFSSTVCNLTYEHLINQFMIKISMSALQLQSVCKHTNYRIKYLFHLHVYTSAPTNLMAVQEGLTSIRVSWSPPIPLGNTTGYRIYYNDSDSSDSVDISGNSTDDYLLTGLEMGATYTISIEATSQHIPNGRVETIITLCKMKRLDKTVLF